MMENVCELFVLPLENTKKRDVKSLENACFTGVNRTVKRTAELMQNTRKTYG